MLPVGWRIAITIALTCMGIPVVFFILRVVMWLWIEMLDQIYELFD